MKWIKVEDRLPNPGERVLVAIENWVGEAYITKEGEWKRYDMIKFEDWMGKVVAWMQMPEYENLEG